MIFINNNIDSIDNLLSYSEEELKSIKTKSAITRSRQKFTLFLDQEPVGYFGWVRPTAIGGNNWFWLLLTNAVHNGSMKDWIEARRKFDELLKGQTFFTLIYPEETKFARFAQIFGFVKTEQSTKIDGVGYQVWERK